MVRSSKPARPIENTLLLVALALLVFATPVIYWWAQDDSPWYWVYGLWMVIIALTAWQQFRGGRHDV